jgi:gluconokinase
VLALDVGTSSCRASLYDTRGRRVAGGAAQVGYQATTTADGGAELDPERLFEQVCSAIGEEIAQAPTPVVGVATTTFWHSLMGVDADGRALTPVYLWLDARSRTEMDRLRGELDEQAVHARTGCVLHWSYWPAKLAWLRRTQPELTARVRRWVSFGEFALERLTGLRGVSVSMASGTGLFDQFSLDWDRDLLETIGVDPACLSPILDESAPHARTKQEFARRWPALRGVPWLAAMGDGACSNVGAGCTTPDRFALMVGTSGAERAIWSPHARFTIPDGAWCYRVDRQRVVLGGALNDGGSLLDWLRRSLRLPSIAQAEADLAAMEPDGHGLTVLPFWGGERSPGWADDARGAVVGLRLHTQTVAILRAALEAVALQFGAIDRRLLEALPASGEVVATGGALLRSPAWMQIVCDVLGRPLLESREREGSSRGVALLALESLGLLPAPLEALAAPVGRRFEPIPRHTERYREAAERQEHLYDALVS